jgi:hypothetical protein
MQFPNIIGDLKKWFKNYPFYKILALVLAIVVYFYVNGEFK